MQHLSSVRRSSYYPSFTSCLITFVIAPPNSQYTVENPNFANAPSASNNQGSSADRRDLLSINKGIPQTLNSGKPSDVRRNTFEDIPQKIYSPEWTDVPEGHVSPNSDVASGKYTTLERRDLLSTVGVGPVRNLGLGSRESFELSGDEKHGFDLDPFRMEIRDLLSSIKGVHQPNTPEGVDPITEYDSSAIARRRDPLRGRC